MKRFLLILTLLLILFQPASAQDGVTVLSTTQATPVQHSDGLWYLSITGDQASIAHICSFGDCGRGYASLYDANNDYVQMIGLSAGGTLAPLPAAPAQQASTITHPATAHRRGRDKVMDKTNDFQWFASCRFRDDGQQLHYWVGYRSDSDRPDSYLTYIGNGPGGPFNNDVQAGTHDHQIEVLLPDDTSTVWLSLDPDGANITISSDTSAPDCGGAGVSAPPTLDDQGVVNNPLVNDRANACYGVGVVCTTDQDWANGYYLIRKQYGML